VSPQGPDFVLPTDVPDVEFGVFVGNGFDVEADGWDGGDVRVEFEFVEDGCEGVWGSVGSPWSYLLPCFECKGVCAMPIPRAETRPPSNIDLAADLHALSTSMSPSAQPTPPHQQDKSRK